MGAQLRALLKAHKKIFLWWSKGFQGALKWIPMMPKRASIRWRHYTRRVWFILHKFTEATKFRGQSAEQFSAKISEKKTEKTHIRYPTNSMGAQLRVPLKPLNTIVLWCSEGFQGVFSNEHTWCRETLVSRTASDFCCFSSQDGR